MPLYSADTAPNPDTFSEPVIGLAIDSPGHHEGGLHCHQRAQLMYVVNGVMQIQVSQHRLILPPTMAAWIPAGVGHAAMSRKPFSYRSLYFDSVAYSNLPSVTKVFSVNILLRELIVRVAEWPVSAFSEAQSRLVSVLLDEMHQAPEQPFSLPMPTDRRLLSVVKHLLAHPADPATLDQLAAQAGASTRTVNRLFQAETGFNFSHWRQQLKIMEASKLLGEGESVTQVALSLGYTQESAFIAMFRRMTGYTPGRLKQR